MVADKYLVEQARRIDVRYWLIKIHGTEYIIDYCNPKDIRNYLPYLFPKVNHEWTIYEAHKFVQKLPTKKNILFETSRGYTSKIKLVTIVLFMLYMINIMFFPKQFNIAYLTYDSKIQRNGLIIVLGMFIILAAVIISLCLLRQLNISTMENKSFIMKQYNISELKLKEIREGEWYIRWFYKIPSPIQGGLALIILIPSLFLVGIIGSSYSQLLIFTIIPFYSMFLGKFLGFIPMDGNRKYQIIEKEGE